MKTVGLAERSRMHVNQFLSSHSLGSNKLFTHPGCERTVMVCSHIWWTELIAHAIYSMGYNVLVAEPWYLFWTDENRWSKFDAFAAQWTRMMEWAKVGLIIGGNTSAMVPHPTTGRMLHTTAGVPLVNFWWDEPRTRPLMCNRGYTLGQYMACLKDPTTLNVIWDSDVMEEIGRYYGVTNTVHVPLGTTPEFWPRTTTSLAERSVRACFLGNMHGVFEDYFPDAASPLVRWVSRVADEKLARPERRMTECIAAAGDWPIDETLSDEARLAREFELWPALGSLLATRSRNTFVRAMADRLGDEFLLMGTGWDRLRLKARADHSGIPAAGEHYGRAVASLNLFGGCVHAGMPLRPYEIAASGGLIFTQYNRELPDLFDPGRECVAFSNEQEMLEQLERVLSHPGDYDAMVRRAYERVVAQHTWKHRMERVLAAAREQFDLPWR